MSLSKKQLQILAFPYTKFDALICDGAIRSGKTSIMTVAFVDWAMRTFNRCNFAICGKTVGSAIKNIITPYMAMTYATKRYSMRFNRSENKLTITRECRKNYFYVYGGKDESSYMLIQGITLAGVLLDEVALMTRSFVEQALARCSVENSRFWFNCNPASPEHWFYKTWIDDEMSKDKNALHLHFLMSDNPSLSNEMLNRYENLYSGVFYDRYIRGMWVVAEGLVYPMFNHSVHVGNYTATEGMRFTVSMDYGIQNPTVMLLWGESGSGDHFALREYYHSGRETNEQKTDEQYYTELKKLTADVKSDDKITLIIDPSATSFIALVRQKGEYRVRKAKNDVLDGLQYVSACLKRKVIKFDSLCKRTIKEFKVYSWDERALEDRPLKENDHAMDATRYYCYTRKILKVASSHTDQQFM